MMDDEKGVTDILEYYGNQIHDAVGHAAYHHPLNGHTRFPIDLVELREVDGKWVGETTITFIRLNERDGCLVRVIEGRDTEYYSILEESIKPAVHKLVTKTEYLIEDVSDEYDGSFEDEVSEDGIDALTLSTAEGDTIPTFSRESQTADFGSTD